MGGRKSTDASAPDVAALESSTFAPALAAAPFAGGDGTDSARASLAAFFNGQIGADTPLNVLFWNPKQGRYSPLWDVFPTLWTAQVVAAGRNTRQTDFGQVENLADQGLVTRLDGAPFGSRD